MKPIRSRRRAGITAAVLVGAALAAPPAGAFPPTEEMRDRAAAVLAQVRLESFAASPARIRPFQQSVLRWRVQVPAAPGGVLRIQLVGGGTRATVGANGSKSVSPLATATYSLVAVSPPLSRALGRVTVEVDRSRCLSRSLPEGEVRARVNTAVDGLLAEQPRLRRRQPDSVEIDPAGIRLKLALKVGVENFKDPDLNVNALIRPWARNGEAGYTLASYDADVDFPWYAEPAELFIDEDQIKETVRRYLETSIAAMLQRFEEQIRASGYRLLSLTAAADRIDYTICPRE